MPRYIQQHSAGGVVVKRDLDGVSILLIKPRGRDRWQLPKGLVDPEESSEQAAIREVREEGGVQAAIITALAPITFFYQMHGQRFVKTVDFFLMEYQSGTPTDHDDEVDDSRWFEVAHAVATLTFKSERNVVAAALDCLDQLSSPANTVT
jgi:8-oxo-dGTP diphosphatase